MTSMMRAVSTPPASADFPTVPAELWPLHGSQTRCAQCCLHRTCAIAAADGSASGLEALIQHSRLMAKGGHLFRQGDAFHSLFIVRTGAFKTYLLSDSGQELVTGLFLPGEVMGLDGYAARCHQLSAVALDTASVCEIPFEHFTRLATHDPRFMNNAFAWFGQEICREQETQVMLNGRSAEQKIAAWLLMVSFRQNHRYLSATEFKMPLLRAELGSFLGLTLETISRILSRFQKAGLIFLDGKRVHLSDIARLTAIARQDEPERQ